MDFKHISEVADKSFEGKKAALRGWIHRHRSGKEAVFFTLRDSSGYIQCVVKKDNKQFAEADKLGIESSLTLHGTIKKDERAPGGYELLVESFEVVGQSNNYPISKDFSDEFLLDVRHLSVRNQRLINVWKIRSTVFGAIHEYFRKNGYYENHSPIFTASSCEGGSTVFEVNYFGKPAYLAQSWQLYAEAMLPALEKIYTIAPSFRAEKSNTARHITEYWHAEMEAAWIDFDDLQKVAEELVAFICHKVAKENAKELKELGRDPKELEKITAPFPKLTYEEALKVLEKKGMKVPYGKDLRSNEEKMLIEEYSKPLIVTRYPKEIKAFYMKEDPKDKTKVLGFDMLAPGVGEIIGGSQRESDINEITKRLKAQGEDVKHYDWYLDTRKYGSVPHGGFGLGTERVIMWICKLSTIKDAIAFPRTLERCTP